MISGLDYFLQPCLLFVLIGVVQFLCEEITFSSTSTLPALGGGVPGSNPPTVSPAGHVVSPLASRGSGSKYSANSNNSGKNAASLGMLQSSLKSLLAGEAFPLRLFRLLKNEISAALGHPAVEDDDQLTTIQNRLLEATNGFYCKLM